MKNRKTDDERTPTFATLRQDDTNKNKNFTTNKKSKKKKYTKTSRNTNEVNPM